MKLDYTSPGFRSLSIEEWHRLGLEGNILPVTICLQGDSMRPLIRRGVDPVTIVPLQRPLKVGDVVLFRGGPARYVVHRVYHLKEGAVCTLGDNCWNPDGWMPLDQVWGLVVRFHRFGRSFSLDCSAARAFGRVWMFLHPLRLAYKRGRAFAAKCYRRVFPKKGVKGNGT